LLQLLLLLLLLLLPPTAMYSDPTASDPLDHEYRHPYHEVLRVLQRGSPGTYRRGDIFESWQMQQARSQPYNSIAGRRLRSQISRSDVSGLTSLKSQVSCFRSDDLPQASSLTISCLRSLKSQSQVRPHFILGGVRLMIWGRIQANEVLDARADRAEQKRRRGQAMTESDEAAATKTNALSAPPAKAVTMKAMKATTAAAATKAMNALAAPPAKAVTMKGMKATTAASVKAMKALAAPPVKAMAMKAMKAPMKKAMKTSNAMKAMKA